MLVAMLRAYPAGPYEQLMEDDDMSRASIGVHIVDVDSREVVFSRNTHKSLIPASLVKLFTATAAMKCYDDTTRWYTQVGYSGVLSDTILCGDIVVVGSIDPTLDADAEDNAVGGFVKNVVDAISQAGIKHITGNIVVDASICAIEGWGEWMCEDIGFYYGAACFGANYRGNEYRLYLQTDSVGSHPSIIGTSIDMPSLQYHNHLIAGAKDMSQVYTIPYATDCMLMGSIPANRERFALRCAIPDAPLFLAYGLCRALQSAGIVVDGEAVTDRMLKESGKTTPAIDTTLYTHASATLSAMLITMMHKSNNLYAESLLRYVALSEDSIATLSRALSVERNILGTMGLDTTAVKQTDGCGLSRKNIVTPHFVASLLVAAYHDADMGQRWVSMLPQAGKDGTVRSFFARQPLPGTLRVKSGSMGGVLCYAGYYEYNGKTYAVVLMGNNHTCKSSVLRNRYEQLLRGIFTSL